MSIIDKRAKKDLKDNLREYDDNHSEIKKMLFSKESVKELVNLYTSNFDMSAEEDDINEY